MYLGACLTMGALTAIICEAFKVDSGTWTSLTSFGIGCLIPVGPLYILYASNWMTERRLVRLAHWRETNLISTKEYDDIRMNLLKWYKARQFGNLPLEGK